LNNETIRDGISSIEVSEKKEKSGGMYYLNGKENEVGIKILKTLDIKEKEKNVI
jgi:hypothetical protein